MDSEQLYSVLNGLVIAHWEVVAYTAVVALLAFLHLNESCLVNTFSFTFYWGFKGLLADSPTLSALNDASIVIYVVSGFAVFVLVQIAYLRPSLGSPAAALSLQGK